MNRKSKIALALILVIVLFAGVLVPAMAAYPYDRAAITKVLKMPVGTNLPTTGSFQYVFTPVSVDDIPTTLPPAVPNVTIAMPTTQVACYCVPACAADVVHYYRESTDLFVGTPWPRAGIYEYSLRETANTITLPDGENMNYSQAVYRVRVHVRENLQTGALSIYTIAVYRINEDNGDPTPGEVKVDPTPGGNPPQYIYSQMAFQNIYTKHTGGGGTDPINRYTLGVTKSVAGNYASSAQYFTFNMTVTRPSLVTEATTIYKAYVVESGVGLTNIVPNGLATAGTDAGGAYANIASGQSFTFNLKANQRLSFTNTHVGASYSVGETGVAGYIPSVIITTNNVAGPNMVGTLGGNLMVPTLSSAYPTNPLVGEGNSANRAAFTNTNDGIEELGLNFSDLPFYGLILLALGGIVVLTVIKARSRKRYN